MNVENVTATIVHYLTFGAWLTKHRPLFAHGKIIHNIREKAHFDAGRLWGDVGYRKLVPL
jgi:Ni,Fe-hydrogenase I small subunit